MSSYNFIVKPKRSRQALLDDAAFVAKRALFALALVAVAAIVLQLLGVDPSGSLMALAVNYKFVDSKAGLSTGGLQGLNKTRGDWAAATNYLVGDTVQNGGFVYRCSVAGASAAGPGPSPNTLVDNAATWVLIGPASSLCVQDAVQQHELGYIALAEDLSTNVYGIGEFVYVKFTGVVVAGDWVLFDAQGKTCVQSPAAAPGASKFSKVGISMGNQINGSFGWVMVRGVHDQANVTAGGTVGNLCAGVGTAGRSTTVQTANYIFDGTVLRNAGVVGTGTVELYWPTCSGR